MVRKLIGDLKARPEIVHSRAVLTYVYATIVKGSLPQFIWLAILGTAGRFLNLLTFVAAIKGVIIAFDAQGFADRIAGLLASAGLSVPVTSTGIVVATVIFIMCLTLASAAASLIRFRGITRLQRRFLETSPAGRAEDAKRDRFLVEQVAPAIDIVVRLMEVALFCFLVLAVIAAFSVGLILFVLPLVAVIPFAIILSRRRRLRLVEDKLQSMKEYASGFRKPAPGTPIDPEQAETARRRYVASLRAIQHYHVQSQQLAGLVMGLGQIAIIVYVFMTWTSTSMSDTAVVPIIFVILGLRQVLTYANEMGRDLSTLLELRSGLDLRSTQG